MKAEIISVGTEILLGDIVNTNAVFLAQQLAELGYGVYYQTVVGDNPERLAQVVSRAKERSNIVLLTGGLGPTDDDLTKQTVASVFADTLVLDEVELEKLESFFATRGVPMAENNKKQAMMPKKGEKLPNENGTAPGVMFVDGDSTAFLMPGPPSEMKPMFLSQVKPRLMKGQAQTIHSLTLHIAGIGESDLETLVYDLLQSENPTAALYAKTGEVHLRITARADTVEQAEKMCQEKADTFRKILQHKIYSENNDDLETTVVKIIAGQHKMLATAESCTGGLLSQRITSVPGSSAMFGFGVCTYSNEMKQKILGVSDQTLEKFGAVSQQTAKEMATGSMQFAGADYGVGITGLAGPDGGSQEKPVGLVYIAVCNAKSIVVKKTLWVNRSRQSVREMAAQTALDMVRGLALDIELENCEYFANDELA